MDLLRTVLQGLQIPENCCIFACRKIEVIQLLPAQLFLD